MIVGGSMAPSATASSATAAGAGSVPGFPQPPLGSPGEIGAIARSLQQAASDLEQSEHALRGAAGTLMGDWQGDAASAYQAASGGLSGVVGAAAATFRECAGALTGYAGALERTQSEMGRLRGLYEQATQRQAMAASTVGGLTTALAAATKPAQVHQLQGDIRHASGQETGAADEAAGYARRAIQLLDEFHHEENRYMQVLTDDRVGTAPSLPVGSPLAPPVIGAGIPGIGFGVPYVTGAFAGFMPGGLDPYNGIFQVGDPWNSPIPGYGVYMDSITPEAVPTNDLTDAITFVAAPVAAGPIEDVLAMGARGLAENLGIGTVGREAVANAQEAGQVERFLAGNYRNGDPLNTSKLAEVHDAGQTAGINRAIGQEETRNGLLEQTLNQADRAGLLPPGMSDAVPNLVRYRQVYVPFVKDYLKAAMRWLWK